MPRSSRTPFAFRLILAFFCLPSHAAPLAGLETRPLSEVAVYPQREAQAQVVSLNESRLAAEISARIHRLPVEPGQVITQGTVVARLDCRDYDLALERAQAALSASEARARLAESQWERAGRLAAEQFISPDALEIRRAELDAARAELAVNRASLNTARHTRSKCVITAPFPAVVLERTGQEGEMAGPGSPLVTLLDTSRLEVRADVQESDAAGLRGSEAVLATASGHYPVRLQRLSPAVNKSSRLMEARLRFVKAAAAPGSSGRLLWRSPLPHLPTSLVTRRQGRLGIFVMQNGQPRFLPLPEATEGRPAPATGLPLDTRVVVKGQAGL